MHITFFLGMSRAFRQEGEDPFPTSVMLAGARIRRSLDDYSFLGCPACDLEIRPQSMATRIEARGLRWRP
jgi:hypothetical protein